MNRGPYHFIMFYSHSSPLSLSASLISSSRHASLTDIPNSTFWDRIMLSLRKPRFGYGLVMLCIIVSCAPTSSFHVPTDDIHWLLQVAFGFSIILFWGDLKQTTGYDSGHWFWGTMLYLAVLLMVLGKAALVSECVHNCHDYFHCPCSLLQHMDEVYRRRYATHAYRYLNTYETRSQRSLDHLFSLCSSFLSTSCLLPVSGSLRSIRG
jgi:hypothetical protein